MAISLSSVSRRGLTISVRLRRPAATLQHLPGGAVHKGDTDKTTPLNPFRYSAKRLDTGSGTLDMGARRFGPDTAHFLTPDFFYGSLSNLDLSVDPLTGNRYDLAGGNPISFKEWDGHMVTADGGGGAATSPTSPRSHLPTGAVGAWTIWHCAMRPSSPGL